MITNKKEIIINYLEEYFPNKIVSKISEHKEIYALVRQECSALGLDIGKYLESIGFEYVRKSSMSISDNEISTELLKLYHDKIISNLSKKIHRFTGLLGRTQKKED